MKFKRLRMPALACLASLLAADLRADGPHDERTDAIEVIGHYENAIGTSNAASQGYITPKLIENKPLRRPAEVLEYVPGVVVTQHSGDGKANQFFLRGFNLDHGTDFATSVAGVPVNMPTHAHGQGYSDLNFLIPELISRVDYKKGPYYAQEGDFSSAGAAHFHYYDKLKQGIGDITLGSFGYRRALLADSPELTTGNLLYAIEMVGNNGPWENPSRFGKQNGVLRYSLGTATDRHSVTLMAYQGRWNATDQIPQRAVTSGQINRLGTVDASDGGNSQRYSLSYERRHTDRDHEFQLNAYAMRYRMRLFSNFTYFLNNPINGDQFEQADRRSVYGVSPTWLTIGKLWDRESILKYGLTARHDVIGTVGLYSSAQRERFATVREDSVGQTSIGGFAEHSLQWSDWFRSVAGARWDRYRFNVNSNIAANSGKSTDQIVSPKLNLIFGPFAQTEFFLSGGRGFHSNDGRGVVARVDPVTLTPVTPAPALVRSRGAEIGARTELVSNLQSSLAIWRLNLGSELVFVGDAGTTTATRPSRRHGVEWSNRYRPREWLILDADLSVSRSEFSDFDPAGNRIPGSINKVASMGASVNDLGAWSGTLQMRYFGPRPLIANDSVRSASTLLWNARLGYKIDPKTRLIADVLNLFNRKASDIDYFYQSQLRGEAAPQNDIHFHPVEPRMLRLSMLVNF
ncbi:MAG: TonB-dependent receptor [Burkholderiales bacterium]